MKELNGIWRLLRFKDYAGAVVFTTCIGVAAAGGKFGWQLILVLLANWLAVGFAFMYNDIEDAPDDAKDPKKVHRNPVSAGIISHQQAMLASLAVAALGVLLYLPLGIMPTILGAICVVLGFLYSYRPWRLKGIAVIDVISHSVMLSSLQVMCGYFTFAQNLNAAYLAPLISMTAASMYGQMFNQVRDYQTDRDAGLRNTSGLVGESRAQMIMQSLLGIAIIAGLYALFIQQLAPWWVFIVGLAMLLLLVIPGVIQGIRKGNLQEAHTPVIAALPHAGTIMMAAWFLLPWLIPALR